MLDIRRSIMPHVSIRPGDSLTVGEDITIQFSKFLGGCSHLDIYDAYNEISVVRGSVPEPTEEEIQVHLRELSKQVISNLSLLEPVQGRALLDSFVSELLMSAAKQEHHEKRRHRQAGGIAAVKANGVHFGPLHRALPDGFEELRQAWRGGQMTLRAAAAACGIPKTTFREAALRAEMATDHAEAE